MKSSLTDCWEDIPALRLTSIGANSSKLMGRFLFELEQKLEFYVSELEGGQKDNAIPRMTRALLTADKDAMAVIEEEAARFQKNLREEYAGTDDGITVKVEEKGQGSVSALTSISQEKVIFYLVQIPFGIQKMSGVIEGLVETSINLGVLKLGEESLRAVSSIRSSVGSAKAALTEKLQYLTEFLGGTCTPEGIILPGSTKRTPSCGISWRIPLRSYLATDLILWRFMQGWSVVFSMKRYLDWTAYPLGLR